MKRKARSIYVTYLPTLMGYVVSFLLRQTVFYMICITIADLISVVIIVRFDNPTTSILALILQLSYRGIFEYC